MKGDVKAFARELEKRTLKFAVRIIKLSANLPNTAEGRVVRNQITKSGTSMGANYREANRSRSKADFKNKIAICESEASETQYWIEVIKETGWLPWERLKPDYEECSELLAIFTSIGK
ncbi:MAG: four helix bundle protein, partial [Pseudomonadota bacterium]